MTTRCSHGVRSTGSCSRRPPCVPLIDHPPVPEEALEFTVWSSDDPNPPFTSPKWTVGNIVRVFDSGWNREWIADDFVSRWRFPQRHQYIALQWGGPPGHKLPTETRRLTPFAFRGSTTDRAC
jgi:hypothetical protein